MKQETRIIIKRGIGLAICGGLVLAMFIHDWKGMLFVSAFLATVTALSVLLFWLLFTD